MNYTIIGTPDCAINEIFIVMLRRILRRWVKYARRRVAQVRVVCLAWSEGVSHCDPSSAMRMSRLSRSPELATYLEPVHKNKLLQSLWCCSTTSRFIQPNGAQNDNKNERRAKTNARTSKQYESTRREALQNTKKLIPRNEPPSATKAWANMHHCLL